MTCAGYIKVTTLAAAAVVGLAFYNPLPRLVWNASASVPIGLYALHRTDDPPVGALVAVAPPDRLADWLAERQYLPQGVPLLKHVAAKPGQHVCRIGERVSVDARPVAVARIRDSRSRRLPVWSGCLSLRDGEIFLLNAGVPDSLDGRYFGPLPVASVIGTATPVLTRDAPDTPLVWRGIEP